MNKRISRLQESLVPRGGLGAVLLIILVVVAEIVIAQQTLSSPLITLAGLVALLALVVTFIQPRIGIWLLVAIQVLILYPGKGMAATEYFYAVLLVATFAGWLGRVVVERKPLKKTILNFPLLLFLSFCLLSGVLAYLNGTDVTFWLRDLSPVLNLALFFIVVNTYSDKKQVKSLFWFIIVLNSLAVFRSFSLMLEQQGLTSALASLGSLISVVVRGQSFELGLAVVFLALAVYAPSLRAKLGWLGLSLLYASAMFLSLTRSLWVALASGTAFLLFLVTRERGARVLGLFLVALLVIMALAPTAQMIVSQLPTTFVTQIAERALTFGSGLSDVDVQARLFESAVVVKAIEESYGVGKGFGYQIQFYERTAPGIVGGYQKTEFLHNSYLNYLLKVGVLGFIAFLGYLVALFWSSWESLKKVSAGFNKAVAMGFISSLVAITISAFSIATLTSRPILMYVGIFSGIVCLLPSLEKEESETSSAAQLPELSGAGMEKEV